VERDGLRNRNKAKVQQGQQQEEAPSECWAQQHLAERKLVSPLDPFVSPQRVQCASHPNLADLAAACKHCCLADNIK
jgi:hypothetical protein